MDKLSKTKLKNGDEYYLIERDFSKEKSENSPVVKQNNNSGFNIKIGSYRKTITTATIFMTRDEDYVGHISAHLYSNGTAGMTMSGIIGIDLPEELSRYRDVIEKHDTALLVSEKYRRQGKATELMKLMFKYLNKKGIKDLEVSGITDEAAMRTYLSTGAEMIGNRKAIYRNIGRFIHNEKNDEVER